MFDTKKARLLEKKIITDTVKSLITNRAQIMSISQNGVRTIEDALFVQKCVNFTGMIVGGIKCGILQLSYMEKDV